MPIACSNPTNLRKCDVLQRITAKGNQWRHFIRAGVTLSPPRAPTAAGSLIGGLPKGFLKNSLEFSDLGSARCGGASEGILCRSAGSNRKWASSELVPIARAISSQLCPLSRALATISGRNRSAWSMRRRVSA